MANFYSRSMFWKLFLPFGAGLGVCAGAAAVFLPLLIQSNAEHDAIEAGRDTVRQYQALRQYYTDNVVAKVSAQTHMQIGVEHAGRPDMVPLPATMIHDLSEKLRESGTTLHLYSPYPFPNRQGRRLDQFATDAWTFLRANPEQVFTRVETVDRKTTVRVAVADRMSVPACVACHNTLASSPKKDWKLGDVRGVLEVDASRQLDTGQRVAYQVLAAFAIMLVLLALFLRLLYQRSIARPLGVALTAARVLTQGSVDKVGEARAIADGNLEHDIAPTRAPAIDPGLLGSDEVGQLLRSVMSLSEAQRALDQAFITMTASLRASRAMEAERDWLKSGQNELNFLMRGEQEPLIFADKVLSYLAERCGAAVGALFLRDAQNGELILAAGYAMAHGMGPGARLGKSEGLLGQALAARKSMCFDQVPAGYLPINSALGSSTPCSLLVVPLLHGERLVGAIELGSFKPFRDIEREFLELAREAVAIGFDVNLARQRTADLLRETEQQSEELRVSQEELEQSNQELEERAELLERQRAEIGAQNQAVEAASREIWNKAEELQKVSAYKTEFMANMSHELRTPLNSMLILSGLLKENKLGNLDERQVEYASTIHGAGQDLLQLINDILDLSKVEAGQVELHPEPAETEGLCRAMVNLFQQTAEQKGLRFTAEVDPGMPAWVEIDIKRTEQILKNLIGNAIKFTHAGQVALRISTPPGAANVLTVPAFACTVSDSGIGVPADKRDLIFDAFKQADGGISRNYGGTGLGLSISLQLARKMGGTLTLESTEGAGSTFTLYLPLAVAAAQPAPAQSAPTPPEPAPPEPAPPRAALPDDRDKAAQKCILIIEDDLAFARILMEFVRQRGFGAIVAVDGESGIALAARHAPSAVLLDVMLPRIDGWEVMRRLRADPRTRAIPVHVITCLDQRATALALGAVGFVNKPVSAGQLSAILDTVEQAIEKAVKRVLVVEDDAKEAASLTALLSEQKVTVTVAASGADAMAKLAAEHYDCMVLDLGLPDMPGADLLVHMQGLEQARGMPVIVHSGRELTRAQEQQLRRYAESIIVKGKQSPERLLDEVTLFLHMVERSLAPARGRIGAGQDAILEGKKVLIVDDDMRNIFSLTSLLGDRGMVVLEADSGADALRQLALHPDLDLILMDIMMPEMDGYEAMRRIRGDARHKELPIIAMTAKAMPGDQQKCLAAGASDYIAKPLDSDKLLSLLRVWSGHA